MSNTDTGVRYTHEALRDNYRSQYGWYYAYDGTALPNEARGHGMHAMGTLVKQKMESEWPRMRNGLHVKAVTVVAPEVPFYCVVSGILPYRSIWTNRELYDGSTFVGY